MELDPEYLVDAVDAMDWRELEATAAAILGRFALVAEAPGAQLRETMTARVKSGSSPPRSTPVCRCGCASQRDHWEAAIASATDRDWVSVWDPAQGAYVGVPEPRATRHAVFRCAEELAATTRTPPAPPEKMKPEDLADFIVGRYAGVAAERAAVLERRRQGAPDVTTAFIRRTRRKNGYGQERGDPLPPDDELVDAVWIDHSRGLSEREVAARLDIGRGAVRTILAAGRPADFRADAAA